MNLKNEQIIFEKYKYVAVACVSKYRHKQNYEDLLQEAYIALILAIKSYEDTHDCSFLTFAHICIKNKINSLISNEKTYKPIKDDIYQVFSYIQDVIPATLSTLEREIVYFRLYNYTFREIAEYYDMKISSIYSKYNRAIEKIRISNV